MITFCTLLSRCIVSVPANSDTVLVIQPQSDSIEPRLIEIGNETVIKTGRHRNDKKYKYMGAMAGTDGRVYIFPCGSEEVLQVDTTTMEAKTVGPNLYDNEMERICQNKWQNGLTNWIDNCVYGIPLSGESVLRIDTNNPDDVKVTTWKLPKPYRLLSKYEGGVVCPNGIMYTVPNNHKAVLRVEPPQSTAAAASNNQQASTQKAKSSDSNEDDVRDASGAGGEGNKDSGSTDEKRDATYRDKPGSHGDNRGKQCLTGKEAMAMTQVTVSEDGEESSFVYQSGIATLRSSAHRVKTNVKNRRQDPKPKDKTGRDTNRTNLPTFLYKEDIFPYDLTKYRLREAFISLLKRCDPEIIGSFRTSEMATSHDDLVLEDFVIPSNTLHRKVNGGRCESAQQYMSERVESDAAFLEIFDELVAKVVLPYMKRRLIDAGVAKEDVPLSFYYQRPPTLRVQPGPGRAGVKPHHDGEYGHQNGELNFWLPLTDRNQNQVDLWCESSPGGDDYHPLMAQLGEIISFHGSSCRHFVNRNETDKTRVSMDFRVGVEGFFDPRWQMNGTTDDHGRREVRL